MTNNDHQEPTSQMVQKYTALHCGVGLLARREHSEFELRQKLTTRKFHYDDIEMAIARLLNNDYLCDSRFANSACRYRVNRGYGWHYIANELKQKGVCSAIIQQLLNNCEIDWYLQAELAYNKRFGEYRVKDAQIAHKDKTKRIRFLQYRGFFSDDIFAIVSSYVSNN